MNPTQPLDDDELALWHAFKRASEAVATAIEREIQEASGLTGAEFGVLDRLHLHDGALRQVDLARSMGWQKSRLSHQLSRMQERGLVTRQASGPSNATAELTPCVRRCRRMRGVCGGTSSMRFRLSCVVR